MSYLYVYIHTRAMWTSEPLHTPCFVSCTQRHCFVWYTSKPYLPDVSAEYTCASTRYTCEPAVYLCVAGLPLYTPGTPTSLVCILHFVTGTLDGVLSVSWYTRAYNEYTTATGKYTLAIWQVYLCNCYEYPTLPQVYFRVYSE
jgi:hypothetical protein